MKKSLLFFALFFGALAIILNSCSNSKEQYARVDLMFNHFFGNDPFRADTSTIYTLNNGEDLIFSRFQYYISNIKLKKSDGTWWSEDESYHIVNARFETPKITLNKLPEGNYTEIQFLIGVDSVRNFSGVQEGALSPSNEMFWSWNTGYIFLMSEGRCLQRPESNPFFVHHIGGFQGPFSAIRAIRLPLDNQLIAIGDGRGSIDLTVRVSNLYEQLGNTFSIVEMPSIHAPSERSILLANNFTSLIQFARVSN